MSAPVIVMARPDQTLAEAEAEFRANHPGVATAGAVPANVQVSAEWAAQFARDVRG